MSKVCPFVPTKDMATSVAFYQALGFALLHHDHSVAIMDHDGATILIQPHYVEDWANNWMAQLRVDDLDAWWTRTEGLPDRYPGMMIKPPTMQPWGIRVGFLSDPAGVLWHVLEA
jgi:uncharacterized glyoxalase superfamily protein PhnB